MGYYQLYKGLEQAVKSNRGKTFAYDVDAQIYFNAVIANSGALSDNEKDYINILVIGLKAKGVWNAMSMLTPLAGGSAESHAINLKNPGAFDIVWVNNPTHSATGVDYNGSSQYGRTGWIPNDEYPNIMHMALYCRESLGQTRYDMGAHHTAIDASSILLTRDSSNKRTFSSNVNAAIVLVGSVSDAKGFHFGTKEGTVDLKYYTNGSLVDTGTAISENAPEIEVYLSCINSNGAPALYGRREMALYSLGGELSVSKISDYNTLVQEYQTSMNRNV